MMPLDSFADVFNGFGKNGTAGDSLLDENYNWTIVSRVFSNYANFD